jgi:hypothetical protein
MLQESLYTRLTLPAISPPVQYLQSIAALDFVIDESPFLILL